MAAVTARLDWQYRHTCSGNEYDPQEAERVVRAHLAGSLERMEQAARQGARLILGPEYFGATELFTVSLEEKRALLGQVNPLILESLRTLASRRRVWLSAALAIDQGGEVVETGVLVSPDGVSVHMQLKNKGIPNVSKLGRGFELFSVDGWQVGIFTCADATDFLDESLELARRGMQVMLVPGCGFAGDDWFPFLQRRSRELGCTVVYADESRAAIFDSSGALMAQTAHADAFIFVPTMEPPSISPFPRKKCGLRQLRNEPPSGS